MVSAPATPVINHFFSLRILANHFGFTRAPNLSLLEICYRIFAEKSDPLSLLCFREIGIREYSRVLCLT